LSEVERGNVTSAWLGLPIDLDTAPVDLPSSQNPHSDFFDVFQIVDPDTHQSLSVECQDVRPALELVQGQVFLETVATAAAHNTVGAGLGVVAQLDAGWDHMVTGVENGVRLFGLFVRLDTTVEALAFGLGSAVAEG